MASKKKGEDEGGEGGGGQGEGGAGRNFMLRAPLQVVQVLSHIAAATPTGPGWYAKRGECSFAKAIGEPFSPAG